MGFMGCCSASLLCRLNKPSCTTSWKSSIHDREQRMVGNKQHPPLSQCLDISVSMAEVPGCSLEGETLVLWGIKTRFVS